jgi:hypothetical protein
VSLFDFTKVWLKIAKGWRCDEWLKKSFSGIADVEEADTFVIS